MKNAKRKRTTKVPHVLAEDLRGSNFHVGITKEKPRSESELHLEQLNLSETMRGAFGSQFDEIAKIHSTYPTGVVADALAQKKTHYDASEAVNSMNKFLAQEKLLSSAVSHGPFFSRALEQLKSFEESSKLGISSTAIAELQKALATTASALNTSSTSRSIHGYEQSATLLSRANSLAQLLTQQQSNVLAASGVKAVERAFSQQKLAFLEVSSANAIENAINQQYMSGLKELDINSIHNDLSRSLSKAHENINSSIAERAKVYADSSRLEFAQRALKARHSLSGSEITAMAGAKSKMGRKPK